jgi:hypothetical protein
MATTVGYDPVNHPHVLKLVGDVINASNGLVRSEVRQALFSSTNPVGDLTGQVDFIICFNCNGGAPNHSGVDHSLAPRPLRGIVQIQRINLAQSAQVANMSPILSLLIHEAGHYWIAFNAGEAKVRTPGGLVDTPTSDQMWQALNAGQPYPPYPMIGRQDAHWSPFFDGDSSPYESGNHSPEVSTEGLGLFGWFNRYSQIECMQKSGPNLTLPGPDGGAVNTGTRYNGLERWIMGDITLPIRLAGHGEIWPSFRVIEPRWAFPFPFQAGLYIEMVDSRRFYFGYDQGPHQLIAQQSNGIFSSYMIELPTDPYNPHDQVGLRFVQRGSVVTLQARVWAPGAGCLPPFWIYKSKPNLNCNDVLGDVTSGAPLAGPDVDHYFGWREVAAINGSAQRIGLSVRTTANATIHARLAADLCLQSGQTITPIATADLSEDVPLAGPARLPDGRLMMPYRHANGTDRYPEDSTNHLAPKWTMEAPDGDFAFGGVVTLDACSQVSWAGGCRPGIKMVGTVRHVKYNDYVLPEDAHSAVRKADPPDGEYKVLFCAAGRGETDISDSDLDNIDKIRRAFEIYFSLITNRRANTAIAYS